MDATTVQFVFAAALAAASTGMSCAGRNDLYGWLLGIPAGAAAAVVIWHTATDVPWQAYAAAAVMAAAGVVLTVEARGSRAQAIGFWLAGTAILTVYLYVTVPAARLLLL